MPLLLNGPPWQTRLSKRSRQHLLPREKWASDILLPESAFQCAFWDLNLLFDTRLLGRSRNQTASDALMLRGKSNAALVFRHAAGGNRRKRFGCVLGHCGCGKQPKA